MSVSAPVPQRLLDSVDDSPVMAYVRDLDGLYLHVNQRYQEFFEVGVDEIRGRTDDELEPRQTVDGPRRASGSISEDEPLQLEYTVAPFDGRPALAVWRFAVRAADGDAVAVCGVAAPVAEAALARGECDRLIAIAQGSKQAEPPGVETIDQPRADDQAVAALDGAASSAARRAHELLSELTAERERRVEAETRAAEADELRRRAEAAETAATAERARAEESLADLNALRAELASIRGRFEGAEARLEREVARAEEADTSAQRERMRVEETLAELNAARGELASVRGRLEGVEAAAQREVGRIEEADAAAQRERGRAEEALSELHEARSELDMVRAALAAEREQHNTLRSQLEAAHAELASEREQRSHSDQEVVDDLRRQLVEAREAAETQRARAEEADARVQAERRRAEQSVAEVDAVRAELESARAQLASEREQRSHGDERTQAEQHILDDLRHKLEHATSTARQEKIRADGAEVALNSERADAEIRVGVAERRIAELEAALADARAHQLQVETEHAIAGPRWDSSAQRAFTTALSQSSDWRVSVKSAIGVLGSEGGWDAVCAWQPDDRNGFASCFAMWTGENQRLGALETATWQRRQPLTESTIGQALGWEESRWLAADPRAADRRLQLLAQHGIRGALIVPVRDGVRPVAALELLTVGTTEPSRELVDAMETMALQLGHFAHLLSAGAQPRWRFGRM